MKNKLIIFCLLILAQATAHADLGKLFKSMEKSRKGPFSLNYLQGTSARAPVLERPPKNILFQAAYRNEIAREMAERHDFYIANLFTTNYYELMGEFVFGNAYGSHPLDHQGLANNGAKALPKAASMVRNWALEKYYVRVWPNSALAKSFRIRGISGSEFEQEYATYFFNFYLGAIDSEFQFLPAVLLAKESPIGSSTELDRARMLISWAYDNLNETYGPNDQRVARMYHIRNIIHNQLSPSAITEIDRYLKDFPFYKREGYKELFEIREILVRFFNVGADKIVSIAKQMKETKIQSLGEAVLKNGPNPQLLLDLSNAVADLKSRLIIEKTVPWENRVEALRLILNTSMLLNKELAAMTFVLSREVFLLAVNAVYLEGFIIKDNWQYFSDEIRKSQGPKTASQVLADLTEIATESLNQAFDPPFAKWVSIEKKMNNFIDDTLKSSAVNSVSLVVEKAKK